MNNYHREKLHVYHFWELKGRLIQKGYNLHQANCKNSPLKLLCNWYRTSHKFDCKIYSIELSPSSELVCSFLVTFQCILSWQVRSLIILSTKKKYLSKINTHKYWHWVLTYIIVSVKVWLAYVFHWIMENIPQGWETWLENHQECHLKKNDIKILCSTSVNFHEKRVSTSLS